MVDRQEEGWKEDQEKEQEDKFLACFSSLIASPSESIYQSRLDRLLKSYEQYDQLLQYLINIWITPWASNFIRCYADQHYHFGNRATSRIEGGHSILKTYLQTSTRDLKMVLEKIELLLLNQHTQHEAAIGQAQDRTPQRLMIPIFAELIGQVTPFALLKVLQQYDLLASKN